jgi:outer membrane protein assembly factor BamB
MLGLVLVSLTMTQLADRASGEQNDAAVSSSRNPFVAAGTEDPGWPFLRGPNYDGHSPETHISDAWPEKGPPVLWTRELGQGYSGFVAWKDRVATQFQTLGGQYVLCLHADSGKTLWQHRYDWPHEPAGVYPGPRATPTFSDGRIYFAAPNGLIACLDARDGKRIWSVNVKQRFAGRGTDFGYACSPTVIDGKVVLPVGGVGASIVALDATDGSVVWKSGDDQASYTPVYPITFRGRRLVLGFLQNALVCLDLQTGERVWRKRLSHGYDEHSAWPIYREPHLWFASAFRAGSELLELTGEDGQPPRTVWVHPWMSNDIFSSVLVDGAIYGFDLRDIQAKVHRPSRGQFRCIDFLTGEQHWSTGSETLRRTNTPQDDVGKRIGHANVIYADGKLILLNDTGELILASATSERYEELARASVLGGELCWTAPTLYRGRLFVRNHSRAACVYLGRPELLDDRTSAAALTLADIPQEVYVDWAATILGVEPEYAFDVPDAARLQDWFLISLIGVMGTSLLVALVVRLLLGPRVNLGTFRWTFWTTAFVCGALGTTLISRWRADFVFTWPVSIFIAFQAMVYEIRIGKRDEQTRVMKWRSRLIDAMFIVSCVGYYLVCRRLSLVFEWAFLCGFAAAFPFALAGAVCFSSRRWRAVWELLLTCAAFSAFYWSSVAVLMWKT